jgi:hypothetical protein
LSFALLKPVQSTDTPTVYPTDTQIKINRNFKKIYVKWFGSRHSIEKPTATIAVIFIHYNLLFAQIILVRSFTRHANKNDQFGDESRFAVFFFFVF